MHMRSSRALGEDPCQCLQGPMNPCFCPTPLFPGGSPSSLTQNRRELLCIAAPPIPANPPPIWPTQHNAQRQEVSAPNIHDPAPAAAVVPPGLAWQHHSLLFLAFGISLAASRSVPSWVKSRRKRARHHSAPPTRRCTASSPSHSVTETGWHRPPSCLIGNLKRDGSNGKSRAGCLQGLPDRAAMSRLFSGTGWLVGSDNHENGPHASTDALEILVGRPLRTAGAPSAFIMCGP